MTHGGEGLFSPSASLFLTSTRALWQVSKKEKEMVIKCVESSAMLMLFASCYSVLILK